MQQLEQYSAADEQALDSRDACLISAGVDVVICPREREALLFQCFARITKHVETIRETMWTFNSLVVKLCVLHWEALLSLIVFTKH